MEDKTVTGSVSLAEVMDLVADRKGERLLAPADGARPLPAGMLAQLRASDAEAARLLAEAQRLQTHSDGLLNGFRHVLGIFEERVYFDLAVGAYRVETPAPETSGDQAARDEGA